MTLFILFAGLGTLVYIGVALAALAIAVSTGTDAPSGLQFALFASLLMAIATLMPTYMIRAPRAHLSGIVRLDEWRSARHPRHGVPGGPSTRTPR